KLHHEFMELAIQAPAIALESQNTAVYFKYILRVANVASGPESDYVQEHIYFCNVTLAEAIKKVQSDPNTPDAILINPDSVSDEISQLREVTKQKAVPIILYTNKYDKAYKHLALQIAADDYHYGAISPAFFKRLDFIKKLKAYKIERGNKPYAIRHSESVPDVELWSMKRAFDIVISATLLLALLPVCLLIALIVKLESQGPVFYISKRAGTGYKIFNFYKFRTMRQGADAELMQLAHLNQYGENATEGVFFKIKD